MAYSPFVRVSITGYLGTPGTRVEHFSTGFALRGPVDGSFPADVAPMSDAIGAWWAKGDSGIGNNAWIEQVKFSPKDASGKDSQTPVVILVGGDGLRGGGIPSTLPYSASRVVSLNGMHENRRAKGRMYLPAPTGEVDPETGKWAGGHELAIATNVSDMFKAIDALSNGKFKVCVASKYGINADVSQVRVGDVPGTVRERRDNLKEVYVSVVVIPFPVTP